IACAGHGPAGGTRRPALTTGHRRRAARGRCDLFDVAREGVQALPVLRRRDELRRLEQPAIDDLCLRLARATCQEPGREDGRQRPDAGAAQIPPPAVPAAHWTADSNQKVRAFHGVPATITDRPARVMKRGRHRCVISVSGRRPDSAAALSTPVQRNEFLARRGPPPGINAPGAGIPGTISLSDVRAIGSVIAPPGPGGGLFIVRRLPY